MKSFSILLARPGTVAAAGSSSGERCLPACGFRLLAETDFLLPLAPDEFTIPVRLGLLASRQNRLSRIGLAERTLSNRTRTLHAPRKQPPNVDYANFSGKFAL